MKLHKSMRTANTASRGNGTAPPTNTGSLTNRAQEDAVSAHDYAVTTQPVSASASGSNRGREPGSFRRWIATGLAALVAGAMVLVAAPAGAAPPAPRSA